MSISLKGLSLVLKTLTVLSDQKNRLAVRVVGRFSSIISMQARWWRKDVRGGVYLVQLDVNNEETQVTTKLPCYLANQMIIKDRRLGKTSQHV